jgi:glycosyltransferase involved in cell wall biosynthesis
MTKVGYSFIIPVYKSVNSLEPIYDGISDLMNELNSSFEVVFVEDNGSDESWKKLLELKKANPDTITLIKLTKNFGQNGATLCGITEAKGEILLTLDDDMQVHPAELKKLIEYHKRNETDIIYGVYNEKSNSIFRNFGSKLIKRIFNKSENGSNVGSSIRLMNSNIASHLRNHSQDHLFINQVISWYTYNTAFVEILRNKRFEGKSGYSLLQLFLISFRLLFLYTSVPLKIMIFLCILSSFGTFAFASYYIYKHFVFGEGLGFLVIIIVAISLILASISIMGIYLNRIYSARVRKPHYAIKVKI